VVDVREQILALSCCALLLLEDTFDVTYYLFSYALCIHHITIISTAVNSMVAQYNVQRIS